MKGGLRESFAWDFDDSGGVCGQVSNGFCDWYDASFP